MRPYLLYGGLIVVGIALGYGLTKTLEPQQSLAGDVTREGGYEYVNPLLSCDISEDSEYAGYSSLKNTLTSLTNSLIAQGKAKRISIYFRSMDSGAWTGVNPDDTFIPASLMKVPLMIAYYREFQTNASLRTKEVLLPVGTDGNAEENYKSSADLAQGATYSLQNLVAAMIQGSDNNAATLLTAMVATTTLDDVYSQFDIPGADETSETMSPQTYMRLFRILYNASYLWRGNSQTALKLLSDTDFTQGLVAGVPAGTTVAHKFGERTIYLENPTTNQTAVDKRELHDCGIVYYPGSPYGICVMTEGSSFDDLASVIAQVSKKAYDAVDAGLLRKGQ